MYKFMTLFTLYAIVIHSAYISICMYVLFTAVKYYATISTQAKIIEHLVSYRGY